jgi:ADP-L-glycero-D-manno-heptose 6-epimerase
MFIVTGANGFIGSALVWKLNQLGERDIIAVDALDPVNGPPLLKRLKYERFISAEEFLPWLETSEAKGIKAIFHMGACSSTTEMNEDFLRRVNTEYTRTLFLAAREGEYPLIYASSGAVYGGGTEGFDDRRPTSTYQPLNPYGRSKANFDIWAETQTSGSRWYGLRFFNVYGPNEYHKGDMASVVFKAVQQIRQNGRLKLFRSHRQDYQDGKQLRDFVYVKEILNWMWELYTKPNVQSGIYNLGSGKARTWMDLANSVFENLSMPIDIDWIDMPENVRNQYQYFTEAKMDKLLAQGLTPPEWTLESGIADYVRNYLLRDDPYLQ